MKARVLSFASLALLTVAIAAGQLPKLDSIGPAIGAQAPDFNGVDQFGRAQTLQTLMGPDGLMLVFFRSADW